MIASSSTLMDDWAAYLMNMVRREQAFRLFTSAPTPTRRSRGAGRFTDSDVQRPFAASSF